MSTDADAGGAARGARTPTSLTLQPDVDLDNVLSTVGNKLAVGLRLEEYEISGVLGEGGFGIVYLAWDHALQRRLAIKEYMPSALARRGAGLQIEVRDESCVAAFEAGLRSFVNEAKLLARFDHPALLKVHRFWQANGTAYMVMPLYEGMTLKKALAERTERPDEAWLRDMLGPVLDALEYLHAASCYHRDIAPDNIMLVEGGRPLLLDFGAARRLLGDMTKAVTVILKSGYAPIEQYGDTPGLSQGPWTDIYALGAVLHYAITGAVPRASVSRMLGDNYQPLAQRAAGRYSDQFLRAIDRMLAVQPKDRPQSIAAVRALLGKATPSAQSDATTLGARRTDGRRRLALAAQLGLAGLALILVLGGIWRFARLDSSLGDAVRGVDPPAAAVSLSTAASAVVLAAPAASAAVEQPSVAAVAQPEPAAGISNASSTGPSAVAEAASVPHALPTARAVEPSAATTAAANVTAPVTAAPAPVTVAPAVPAVVIAAPPERATRRVEAPAAVSATTPAKPVPRMRDSARCTDIIQRVSIGEQLTAADRRILNEECRP